MHHSTHSKKTDRTLFLAVGVLAIVGALSFIVRDSFPGMLRNDQGQVVTAESINKEFKMTSWNGKDLTEKMYKVDFSNSSVSGKICNSFRGEYKLQSGMLLASQVISTKMACAPDIMAVEDAFYSGLNAGFTASWHNNEFVLMNGNHTFVFVDEK